MELAQIKAKIAALSRKQKIIASVGGGLVLLLLIASFLIVNKKIKLGKLSKTLPKATPAASPSSAPSPSQVVWEDWQYPGYRIVDQSEEFLATVKNSLTESEGKGRGFTQLKDCAKRVNYFPQDLAPIELEKIINWYEEKAKAYGWQFQEGDYSTLETPRLYTKGNQKLYVTVFVYAQSPAIDLCWKD